MAVADVSGVSMEAAAKEFAHFHGLRQNIIKLENRYTIIDDTYNASPDSMRASLDVLCHIETTGKRIAVLGDMFELGENSLRYHYEVGQYIAKLPLDEVLVVGTRARAIVDAIKDSGSGIDTATFTENEEAVMFLMGTLMPEDVILVKGSNGMHMNEIVQLLKQ